MRRNLHPEDLGDLLSQARVAVLATQSLDGTVLLSPVWHEWDDGGFVFVTFSGDIKLRHVQADPRVTMIVAEDAPPYRGIEVRGSARVISEEGAGTLRRLATRYLAGRDVDGYMAKIAAWMREAGHTGIPVLRVEPGTLRIWDYADEEW